MNQMTKLQDRNPLTTTANLSFLSCEIINLERSGPRRHIWSSHWLGRTTFLVLNENLGFLHLRQTGKNHCGNYSITLSLVDIIRMFKIISYHEWIHLRRNSDFLLIFRRSFQSSHYPSSLMICWKSHVQSKFRWECSKRTSWRLSPFVVHPRCILRPSRIDRTPAS